MANSAFAVGGAGTSGSAFPGTGVAAISAIAEVQLWYALAISNGGSLTSTDITLAENLVTALKAAAYYTNIRVLYPFFGGNIAAATTPLINKNVLGIPQNVGPFVNADCGNALGLKGDGTSKVLNIGLLPYWINANGNCGVGGWVRNLDTTGSETEIVFASSLVNSPDYRYGLDIRSTAAVGEMWSWGSVTNAARSLVAGSARHYYGERSGPASRSLFAGGSTTPIATNTTSESIPISTTSSTPFCILGAINANGGSFTYNKSTLGVVYFTDGALGATNYAALHTLLNTYIITATGR